jgi:hypothetical protein
MMARNDGFKMMMVSRWPLQDDGNMCEASRRPTKITDALVYQPTTLGVTKRAKAAKAAKAGQRCKHISYHIIFLQTQHISLS